MADSPELTAYRTVHPDPDVDAGLADGLDSPESVVEALYDVLSGPAERERERDWDRLRALCLPGARFLICHGWDEKGRHVPGLREWDVDGFIADARRAYAEDGFWEREIGGRTERFGNLAHRFSAYESRVGSESSEPVGRGINTIQLVRYDGRWWIASVVWDSETPDQPIPPEYA